MPAFKIKKVTPKIEKFGYTDFNSFHASENPQFENIFKRTAIPLKCFTEIIIKKNNISQGKWNGNEKFGMFMLSNLRISILDKVNLLYCLCLLLWLLGKLSLLWTNVEEVVKNKMYTILSV